MSEPTANEPTDHTATTTTTAVDVTLFYYQPDKAHALREAVLPLARRAAAG